jgi:hypothetical protein
MTGVFAGLVGSMQGDIVGPTVTISVSSTVGTSDSVTWTITDAASGVASADIQQVFTQDGTPLSAVTYSIPFGSLSGGTYVMSIPTNRRNTPSGAIFQAKYRIVATDNAGNTTTTSYSTNHYTKPLGTYTYATTDGDSRNLADTAWNNYTAANEGTVGVSATKAYGAWFYGADAFTDDNFTQWEPDSGTIFLKRAGATDSFRGDSGTFSIKMHGSGTKSGAITTLGTTLTQSLSGDDASASLALQASQLANIKDGDGQGFALTAHSTGLGFLRGKTDSGGLVTLVYS